MGRVETAQSLVELVRSDTGIYDRAKARDGFDSDYGTAPRSILKMINEGLTDALGTGYRRCRFFIPVVANQREYEIDYWMGNIVYVAFNGVRVDPATMGSLMTQYPTMLTDTATSTPTNYYSTRPNMIGLYPAPLDSDIAPAKAIEIMADDVAADMTETSDSPSRLPVQFQSRCRFYASGLLCASVAGESGYDLETYLTKSRLYQAKWSEFKDALQSWASAPELSTVFQVTPDIPLGGDYGMDT